MSGSKRGTSGEGSKFGSAAFYTQPVFVPSLFGIDSPCPPHLPAGRSGISLRCRLSWSEARRWPHLPAVRSGISLRCRLSWSEAGAWAFQAATLGSRAPHSPALQEATLGRCAGQATGEVTPCRPLLLPPGTRLNLGKTIVRKSARWRRRRKSRWAPDGPNGWPERAVRCGPKRGRDPTASW